MAVTQHTEGEPRRAPQNPDQARALETAFRRAAGDDRLTLTAPPVPVNVKGSVLYVELGGSEESLTGPAIVRISGDIAGAARERAVQTYLSQQGFPTPAVLLSGSEDDELGGAWVLTALVDGLAARVHGGRNPVQAARSLGDLGRRPALLAELMVRLHAVDPHPLEPSLTSEGVDFDWYDHGIDLVGRLGGSAKDQLIEWLEANRPAPSGIAISHGDLHPGNVVIGPDGPQVIDWGIATLAPPARDVACTMFALANFGGEAPGFVRPAAGRLGRRQARQFLRFYRREATWALPDDELTWHRVLGAASRIFWAARADRRHMVLAGAADPDRPVHLIDGVLRKELPIHAELITDVTGVALEPDLVGDITPIPE